MVSKRAVGATTSSPGSTLGSADWPRGALRRGASRPLLAAGLRLAGAAVGRASRPRRSAGPDRRRVGVIGGGRNTMEMQELKSPALDGFPLAATLRRPAVQAKGAIIINCAMGVSRGFYSAFCAHLCAAGYAVLSYDYRGIGG